MHSASQACWLHLLTITRTIVDQPPPAVSQAPIAPPAPPTTHQPYPSFSFYTDPNSNTNTPYSFPQPPQPVGQNTSQLPVNPYATPVELVPRVSSPVSNYNIPKYGYVIPNDPNPRTNHGSSWSTEGPRTITPTTSAETQGRSPTPQLVYCPSPCSLASGPSITELAWPSSLKRTDEDSGLDTSFFQTSFPTPDGRRTSHIH